MAMLEGTISITGLPPHQGLIVNLYFYAVATPDAPPPYNGDPPAEAATDSEKVFERVDLDQESHETTFAHPFGIERPAGYYYVQLGVILFRKRDGKVFAQVEHFSFGKRPLHVAAEQEGTMLLPVLWPTEPLDALHHYGTVTPQKKRPWWQFW